jgi:flagellar basal body rod protein FlgG
MMQILTAQRAYEANAKGVQAAETPDYNQNLLTNKVNPC